MQPIATRPAFALFSASKTCTSAAFRVKSHPGITVTISRQGKPGSVECRVSRTVVWPAIRPATFRGSPCQTTKEFKMIRSIVRSSAKLLTSKRCPREVSCTWSRHAPTEGTVLSPPTVAKR